MSMQGIFNVVVVLMFFFKCKWSSYGCVSQKDRKLKYIDPLKPCFWETQPDLLCSSSCDMIFDAILNADEDGTVTVITEGCYLCYTIILYRDCWGACNRQPYESLY